MRRMLLLVTFILMIACSFLPGPTVSPTLVPLPSHTLVPTQIPPTLTPTPTQTLIPTVMPTLTASPTVALGPTTIITAQNAAQVVMLGSMENLESRRIVFSPDGSKFAVSSGNEVNFAVRIYQTLGGILLQTFDGYTGIVWDVAFSMDGQTLVSAADDKNHQGVRIWNIADGTQVKTLENPAMPYCVAYSPDGKILAVGGLASFPDGIVWLYDAVTLKPLRPLGAAGQNVLSLAFSPDASLLVGGGTDGRIRVWRANDGFLLKTLSKAPQVNNVRISPDGSLLVSNFCSKSGTSGCEKGGVVVWDLKSGVILQEYADLAETMAFSPDGMLLLTGSGKNDPLVRLRSVKDGSLAATLAGQTYSAAFAMNGTVIVTLDFTSIKIWGIQ
jgi:WD40 repeat protein